MRINYEKVLRQAGQIEDLGDELKRIADEINTMMGEIPGTWGGEAANAYLKACEELKQKISSSSQKIKKISRDIRNAAQRIHEEDERMVASVKINNK